MNNKSILRFEDVTFKYSEIHTILDEVNFSLRRGAKITLMGQNGAGKSTLMSVLFGLYQPEHGQIKKNGQVVDVRNPNDANDLGISFGERPLQYLQTQTEMTS